MMQQLGLFTNDVLTEAQPEADLGLTCAFGEPWMGPHPLCAAQVERDCAEFDRLVALGQFDAQGYTPAERKAQQRKKSAL